MPATRPPLPARPPANAHGRWAPAALPTPPRRATGCACWSSRPGGAQAASGAAAPHCGPGPWHQRPPAVPARQGSGAPHHHQRPPPRALPAPRPPGWSTCPPPARPLCSSRPPPALRARWSPARQSGAGCRCGGQKGRAPEHRPANGKKKACRKCRQPTHSRGIRPTGWLALLYFAIPFMNSALRPTLCACLPSATLGPLPSPSC